MITEILLGFVNIIRRQRPQIPKRFGFRHGLFRIGHLPAGRETGLADFAFVPQDAQIGANFKVNDLAILDAELRHFVYDPISIDWTGCLAHSAHDQTAQDLVVAFPFHHSRMIFSGSSGISSPGL